MDPTEPTQPPAPEPAASPPPEPAAPTQPYEPAAPVPTAAAPEYQQPAYPTPPPYQPDPSQQGQYPATYQPGAPLPPGYQPGAPLPPGAIPAFGAPMYAPPQSRSRSKLVPIVIALFIVVAIAAVGVFASGVLSNQDEGKVVVSMTKPTTCHVSNQVTQAKTSDTVYIVGIFKNRVTGSTELTMEISKDGQSLGTTPAIQHGDVDCFSDEEALTDWSPGTYTFAYKTGGTVQAEGTLEIKQP